MSDYQHSSDKSGKKDVFDKIGSKNSFFFGLGSGVAGFFVVGFFVLLGVFLTSGGNSGRSVQANNNPSVNPSPTHAAPNGGTQISLTLSEDDWVRGDANAPITIVEFSDFDCPFCQRHHDTMNQLIAQYDGQVNWVYRHFPLTQLHPDAVKKANAAECAGGLGGEDSFWAYADAIFAGDEGGTDAELSAVAGNLGLNTAKFESCLTNGDYSDVVDNDSQNAVSAGGTGTPYNVIIAGDQQIPVNGAVPLEQFKSIIDSLL